MKPTANETVFHQAVMWRGLDMLPRLRAMSAEERMRVMQEASEHSSATPLWLDASRRKFTVASWDLKPITGAQVTALLVFGLWVHLGEREEMAGGLVTDWPEIKVASYLSRLGL